MTLRAICAALAVAVLAPGCASAPRPRILDEVERVRAGAAAKDAEKYAPQAYAHAEKLRLDASRAFQAGDRSGAQLLAEHAIAAYSHGFVLARIARGDRRLGEARARRHAAEGALGGVDEQQTRVAAEADALELQLKVARDAVPMVPNAPAGPEREQARLLCVATQLLSPASAGLSDDLAALDKLDTALGRSPDATPLDEAIRLRSACLGRLGTARRGATAAAPAGGIADALMAELSQAGGLAPSRDDRGVVVTLRGVFARGVEVFFFQFRDQTRKERRNAQYVLILCVLRRLAAFFERFFPVVLIIIGIRKRDFRRGLIEDHAFDFDSGEV